MKSWNGFLKFFVLVASERFLPLEAVGTAAPPVVRRRVAVSNKKNSGRGGLAGFEDAFLIHTIEFHLSGCAWLLWSCRSLPIILP